MKSNTQKKEINQILDTLPRDATWDDLMYRIYVRQAIEKGLKDNQEGKTLSTDQVRARYELSIFFPHRSHHRYARCGEDDVG